MDYRIVYLGAQIIFGILFLVLFFLQRIDGRGERSNKLGLLYMMFFLITALDSIWVFIDGVPRHRMPHIALQLFYLFLMSFTGYIWFLYTLDLFPAKSSKLRDVRRILIIPALIQLVLLACSVKTGWVFVVDEAGSYVRGNLHLYHILVNFVYMILGSIVALRCRRESLLLMDKRRFAVAALFPVPTIILASIQIALPPGLQTMEGGVLIGLFLFYGTSQNQRITRDYLTGLPNRIAFEIELAEHIGRQKRRSNRRLYLMEGDLNRFKHINDTYGHPAGDRALLSTAKVLSQFFSIHEAAVFRSGGDEFMMIAERKEPIDVSHLQNVLNEKLADVESSDPIELSMSLGACEYDGKMDLHEFIDAADKELYTAKKKLKRRSTDRLLPTHHQGQ